MPRGRNRKRKASTKDITHGGICYKCGRIFQFKNEVLLKRMIMRHQNRCEVVVNDINEAMTAAHSRLVDIQSNSFRDGNGYVDYTESHILDFDTHQTHQITFNTNQEQAEESKDVQINV